MKNVGIGDLMELRFLSALSASPDGGKVGFAVQQANAEGDGYDGWIYLLDAATGAVKRLTGLGGEKNFIWLSDTELLFPAMRDKKLEKAVADGEMWTAFYKIDIAGGEAAELFRVPMRVSDIAAAGGGRFVLKALSIAGQPDLQALSPAEKAEALKKLKAEQGYEVAEEIPFWSNGTAGFTAGRRQRLWLYDSASGACTPITGEKEQAGAFSVQDGKVLFTAALHEDKIGQANGLYLFDIAAGARETLVPQKDFKIHAAHFAAGGILAAASAMKTFGNGEAPNFYRFENGRLTCILENDLTLSNSVASDVKLGKTTDTRGCEKYLTAMVTQGFGSYLLRVGGDGKADCVGKGWGTLFEAVRVKGGYIAVAQKGDRLQELWRLSDDGSDARLTDFNESYFASHAVVTPEYFTFERDGATLDGWVMLPPGRDGSAKIPAVFNIHGGPKTAYGPTFMHEMQAWCGAGYAVMFTNPHGSSGRGDAFADIRGKYGTVDYDDLMAFVDEVLRRYPCIDGGRIGVTGGSYGGFMTNWIVGHTDRFRAAATQRSICNWVSFFGTTDIGYFFGEDQMAATPWSDIEKVWWHSPLKYAESFKTPTLVLHSDQDMRCWWTEALQMFTALKYHGVPARLWVCHGENHELSRGGKPKNRIRRLEEITAWFDKYVK